jgi:putative RecB family exonuclease
MLPLRSVSQLNQYVRCPQAYKLGRIDKVWARPAAWLPQGTAFHAVAEEYERRIASSDPMELAEAKELFKEYYASGIGELADLTPNLEWWFWSGPYNGERDIERRYHIGLEQVEKFVEWRSSPGQHVFVDIEGKPAIELAFKIDLDGILVRGFIDAVVVTNDGELRVRDYKTGNTPGDDFQLGAYSVAVEELYGVKPPQGDYFMAGKKGSPPRISGPYDLSHWTREAVSARFHEVEAQIQAGNFEPLPEPSKCGFCDVNYSCPVFKG